MQGFFNKKETTSTTRPEGRPLSCISCGLYKHARSPKMKPYGKFKKHIMVIGEAPGEYEDRIGKPFQGKTGRVLQRALKEHGIDLFEDCVCINAVNCRPKDNETPKPNAINCCRSVKVLKAIEEYRPEIILLLGGVAVKSLIGHRWMRDLGGITKWRGWSIPDRDFRAWIVPTFHPSYVERSEDRQVRTVWHNDLKMMADLVGVKRTKFKPAKVHVIDSLEPLDEIKHGAVSFDYETTGIKPHAPGHYIVTCAVAYDPNNAYSFVVPKRKSERKPLVRLLTDLNVDKIAQNMKFEDNWTFHRLIRSTQVANWMWDPMLAAHVLDNRKYITNLKFQTYVNLGIVDYDSDVSPYLKPTDKIKQEDGANAINQIDKLLDRPDGLDLVLKYNGMDSINTYRIALIQMEKMNYDFLPF